jgi:hypothetical protein
VANVTPEVTDIARLRDAFDRLEEAGFVVRDGGCCSSCNWGHIDREHPEAEDVIHVNDQALDGAFGEIEPSIEWRAYLDAAAGEAEPDARYEQWLDHWYSEDFGGLDPRVAQRPGMLKNSLWLQHDGDTARAVEILRGVGLDAHWGGDPKAAIEVKPSVEASTRLTRPTVARAYDPANLFAELCNMHWFATNPDWEKDGSLHTSPECRRVAAKIVEIVLNETGIDLMAPERWSRFTPATRR